MVGGRVSEERFTVTYDGPALVDHIMDVKDLAPALLSFSEAFHQAQRVLEPTAPQVSVRIKAFDAGSFEILMLLTEPGFLDSAINVLTGREIQAVGGLGALASVVFGSVKAVKWLGGRHLKTARPAGPGKTELITEDGTSLRVDSSVVPLLRDVEYRRTVSEIVRPLAQDGIERMTVTDTTVRFDVTKADLPAFVPPEVADEDLGTSRRVVTLQLLGVEFDSRKWRFTDGTTPLSAAIEDRTFQAKIERQEVAFGKNDLLKVGLRTHQYRDASGRLKAEHAIEEVLEHIDGGRQLPLDFSDE